MLQHVAVPVIENHVCESWHRRKGIDIRIYDEMMCAGYELGQRDACQVMWSYLFFFLFMCKQTRNTKLSVRLFNLLTIQHFAITHTIPLG